MCSPTASIAGSFHSDYFQMEPSDRTQAIAFDEFISFLLIALPELDTDSAHLRVDVRGLTGSGGRSQHLGR